MVAKGQTELLQPSPQVAQQLSANLVCDAQVALHQAIEILAEQHGQLAVAGGPNLSGADGVIEQTQFTEELPWAKARSRSADRDKRMMDT